jgi:hypothetical protein
VRSLPARVEEAERDLRVGRGSERDGGTNLIAETTIRPGQRKQHCHARHVDPPLALASQFGAKPGARFARTPSPRLRRAAIAHVAREQRPAKRDEIGRISVTREVFPDRDELLGIQLVDGSRDAIPIESRNCCP